MFKIYLNNNQMMVGDHLMLRDFGLWDNIYECVCCYNRCNCNALKRFWP
jgi:hypothetical protein